MLLNKNKKWKSYLCKLSINQNKPKISDKNYSILRMNAYLNSPVIRYFHSVPISYLSLQWRWLLGSNWPNKAIIAEEIIAEEIAQAPLFKAFLTTYIRNRKKLFIYLFIFYSSSLIFWNAVFIHSFIFF